VVFNDRPYIFYSVNKKLIIDKYLKKRYINGNRIKIDVIFNKILERSRINKLFINSQ